MRKLNPFFCLLICAALCLSLSSQVFAVENGNILRIVSVEGFLNFAKNCALDSYSQELTVLLCSDLDLSGREFSGIPTFSGTFDGQNHRITGLSVSAKGSHMGLFRYLTADAIVKDLHAEGIVAPQGSASTVGGIAGHNQGHIQNCSFTGAVSGIDNVGGIVGINQLTGIISGSSFNGSAHGKHFIGGIAGSNLGVIRDCTNTASINTTVEENDVELEDITLDSITSSESAATVTDIGGICGTGSGIVRCCVNRGSIGYPLIGYNVGGIAGSFSGYLYDCINHGAIDGRKEVGGIVGQLEPAVRLLYEEDTLQTLQQQMDQMSALAGGAGAQAQSGANALNTQAEKLEDHLDSAQDALSLLIPDRDDPVLPDEDTLQAAQNALSASLSGITESLNSMAVISETTIGALSSSIQDISGQMNAISGTISGASENLGGTISDVSDADTENDLTAKLYRCTNLGAVKGDWNIGGITGAMSLENDLDPESDLNILGSSSLNFDMELRAVILECENKGIVTCKKRNAGGIVGWISLGLVRECVNYADIDAAAADYTGGIAGSSAGFIRRCSVKCALSGDTYVGGIAGTASTVSDCSALVKLAGTSERCGAILGSAGDGQLSDNFYLPVDEDPGAIDGIRYAGKADSLTADAFFALENVPDSFGMVSITLVLTDGSSRSISLPYGSILSAAVFPSHAVAGGEAPVWTGPVCVGDPIYFDCVFTAAYSAYSTALESNVKAHNGLPVFLLQGKFPQDAQFIAQPLSQQDAIDGWTLVLPESSGETKLRYLVPEGFSTGEVRLTVKINETWQDVETAADGSYLVFAVPEGIQAVCAYEVPTDYTVYVISAIALIVLIAAVTVIVMTKHRKKKPNA